MTDREWQPIETAPSGERILVTGGPHYCRSVEVVWADGKWWNSAYAPASAPKFWMPLPPPPGDEMMTRAELEDLSTAATKVAAEIKYIDALDAYIAQPEEWRRLF